MFNSQTTTRAKQMLLAALLTLVLAVTAVGAAAQLQLVDGPASALFAEGPAEGIEIANGGSGGVSGGG